MLIGARLLRSFFRKDPWDGVHDRPGSNGAEEARTGRISGGARSGTESCESSPERDEHRQWMGFDCKPEPGYVTTRWDYSQWLELGATWFRRADCGSGGASRTPVGLVNHPGNTTKANEELALAA